MSSPSIAQQLKAQLEFYFGDANLSKNRFLSKTLHENGGWLDISVLCGFKKVQAITSDVNVVKEAIKLIDFLELNGNQVRRKTPIAQKSVWEIKKSTLRVEPISLDATIEGLHQIFDKYGPVVFIDIPKNKEDHKRMGYALVEFDKRESARNALKSFSKGEMDASSSSSSSSSSIQFKLTSLSKWEWDRKKENKKKAHTFTPGLIVHFDNGGETLERSVLSKILGDLYPTIQIMYISIEPNSSFGFIRFSNPGDAQKVVEEVVGERGLLVSGKPLALRILEGKEEKDYWEMIAKKKKTNKKNQKDRNLKKEKGKKRKDVEGSDNDNDSENNNDNDSENNNNSDNTSSDSENEHFPKKLKEHTMDE